MAGNASATKWRLLSRKFKKLRFRLRYFYLYIAKKQVDQRRFRRYYIKTNCGFNCGLWCLIFGYTTHFCALLFYGVVPLSVPLLYPANFRQAIFAWNLGDFRLRKSSLQSQILCQNIYFFKAVCDCRKGQFMEIKQQKKIWMYPQTESKKNSIPV